MPSLKLDYLPIGRLHANPRNARVHSDRQVRQIAGSIRTFGFTNPVLIDSDNTIIAGHGRVEAARLLNQEQVPVIRLEHMNDAQLRAYMLADNRLAEKAGWDTDILNIELQHLTEIELDFDIEVTGFETAEIDLMLGDGFEGADPGAADPADAVPDPGTGETATTRPGDLWQLGDHRLICADSLETAAYTALMAGGTARMVFTDPPYNVPINGHVSGLGKARHREFAMASGEMTSAGFTGFLETVLQQQSQHVVDGGLLFVCMDWRHVGELDRASRTAGLTLKNICVWVKSNGGMGSLYRSRHELVFVLKSGTAPHVNNIELGRFGRYRTNVWEYAGVNTFGTDREAALAAHPTVRPVALVADAIRDCSKRRDIILDPFGGSGTTLIAAERTGRRARLVEIDPRYCDVTIRRWQALTGQQAVLADTGEKFDAVVDRRTGTAVEADDAA